MSLKILFLMMSMMAGLAVIQTDAQEWKELKGEHSIVYYSTDEKFAKELSEKTEYYYRTIATDLGYPRYSEFWTWDKRVKIYMYPDHQSFLKATKQPEWSHGMAEYIKKEIIGYEGGSEFSDSFLPHEMAHLIFREFVGFKGEVPLWLDEGVAQWAEEAKRREVKAVAMSLYKTNALLTLADITKLDIRLLTEMDRVFVRPSITQDGGRGVVILNTANLVNRFYLESAALVGFLIEKYGSDGFATLCRQLRDGKSLDEALRFAYASHTANLNDLELRWLEFFKEGGGV